MLRELRELRDRTKRNPRVHLCLSPSASSHPNPLMNDPPAASDVVSPTRCLSNPDHTTPSPRRKKAQRSSFHVAAFCRLAEFLSLVSADRSLVTAVGWRHPRPKESGCHSRRREFLHETGSSRLSAPFLPPRVFVKCLPIRRMVGRGGGDRTRSPIELQRGGWLCSCHNWIGFPSGSCRLANRPLG